MIDLYVRRDHPNGYSMFTSFPKTGDGFRADIQRTPGWSRESHLKGAHGYSLLFVTSQSSQKLQKVRAALRRIEVPEAVFGARNHWWYGGPFDFVCTFPGKKPPMEFSEWGSGHGLTDSRGDNRVVGSIDAQKLLDLL